MINKSFDNPFDGKNVTIPDPVGVRSGRLLVGDKILGRYVVHAELGEGGMGVVYKCFDEVGGVDVAIKGLPPEVVHNRDELEAVKENFQLVRSLRHPNIAAALTLEREERTGEYYLVMDYVPGESLNRWMAKHRGKVNRTQQLAVLRQIAEALDYAHRAHPVNIIHRDIKPENILVDDSGRVKILDFGLAAQVRTSMSHMSLQVRSKSGTPAYKSPEQWRGLPQRAQTDQYALGVIAYKMLSGDVPFDGDDIEILGRAVLNEPVSPVDDASEAENAVLVRVLAKLPNDRYPTCVAFVEALNAAMDGKFPKFESVSQTARTISEPMPVRRWWIGGMVAVVSVAVVLCVMYRCFFASVDIGKREKPCKEQPKPIIAQINPVPTNQTVHVPVSPVPVSPVPVSPVTISHVHRYGDAWKTVVMPSCGVAGLQTRECVALGCTCPPAVETSLLPATGRHTWGDWKGDVSPQVGLAGKEKRTCMQCAQEESREIPPLNPVVHVHSFGTWRIAEQPTCAVPGKRVRTCKELGCSAPEETEILPALTHDWAAWTNVVAPQVGVAGERRRQCLRCNQMEEQRLPPLPGPDLRQLVKEAVICAKEARKTKGKKKKEYWQRCKEAAEAVLRVDPTNREMNRLLPQAENGLSTADLPKNATPENTSWGKPNSNGLEFLNTREDFR